MIFVWNKISWRGKLIAPFLFGVFVFLLPNFVFAYNAQITHQMLTRMAGELSGQFNAEEINWLAKGAEEEDIPPRWLNHFYDPVTGGGWNGEGVITLNAETIRMLSAIGLSPDQALSAKDWAQDSPVQIAFFLYEGNQTWKKAISEYAAGNKKAGLIALGHVLHLLEDMTVPDHTRNDTHLGIAGDPASPYETAAKGYTINSVNNISVVNLNTLNDYFDVLANYSNKNFVSENSINKYPVSNTYENKINKTIYIFTNINNDKYPVYLKEIDTRGIKYSVDDPFIMSAYWSRLAPKAIGAGAGVIKLFFKEVEEAKKNPEKYKTSTVLALLTDFKNNRLPVISIFGELSRLNRISESVIAFLGSIYSGTKAEEPSQVASASPASSPIFNGELPVAPQLGEVSPPREEKPLETSPKPPPPPVLVEASPLVDPATAAAEGGLSSPSSSDSSEIIPPPAVPEPTPPPSPIVNVETQNFASLPETTVEPPPVYIPPTTHMGPALPPLPTSPPAGEEIIPPDTTPPEEPTIISPSSESSYFTNKTSLTLAGEKSIDTVEIILSVDGASQSITSFVSSTAWVKEIDLTEGEHQIGVKAKDAVGNASDAVETKIIIDVTPPSAPTISSPTVAASYLTNSLHVNFAGQKSADASAIIILIDDSSELFANFDSPAAWSKDLALASGEHTVSVKARDAVGNTSEATTLKITVDVAPPVASFAAMDGVQKHREFLVSWGAADGEIAGEIIKSFDVDWLDLSSTTTFESWFATTTSTAETFSGDNGHTYRFRVRATDEADNVSDWSESADITVRLPHVVISEIQIGGKTAADEFVELYNPADESVNLAGWKLQRITSSGGTSENLLRPFPSATISAHGFYLIIHPTGYTGATTPDAVYSTGSSLAPNNTAVLYNVDGEIIDKLGFGNVSEYEGAPASGLNSSGGSLERKASANSTAETMSSGGSDELAGNAEDTDNNAADFILRVNPDPQGSESLPEPRSDEYAKPGRVTDLRAALTETTVSSAKLLWSAPADAKLTGEAIYEVRYLSQPLATGCALNILWPAASRVVPNPVPADAAGTLESLAVGGLSSNSYYCFGIKTWNGYYWSDISNLYVVHTLKTGGSLAARGTFLPSPVNNAMTLTPENNPYIVDGQIWVNKKLTILPGVIIKFRSTGNWPAVLLIAGELDARGTAENPIIFTSLLDDRFGGDTDGAAHTPAKGDWGYLDLNSGTSTVVMQYANFYFGGDAKGSGNASGVIYFSGNRPLAISNSLFENNNAGISARNWNGDSFSLIVNNSIFRENIGGIRIENVLFDISGNTFENNAKGFYTNGLRAGTAVLSHNNFSGNSEYGAQNQGTLPLDARGNWWGDASGPAHTSNPGGAGDKVSDKIDFSGWSSQKF